MHRQLPSLFALTVFALGAGAHAQDAPVKDSPAPDPGYLDYVGREGAAILPDGRRIQIVCMGEGSPTVLLTAGLGGWGADWRRVQKPIAEHTRVCTWDRPGFGFSDASPTVQTTQTTTTDLEAAIVVAGIDGPFVVVGHSLGAYESMIFADRHPDQVVGFVSVDGSFPDQDARFREVAPAMSAFFDEYFATGLGTMKRCAADLEAGRVSIGSADPDDCLTFPPDYPAEVAAALARLDSDGRRPATQASIVEHLAQSISGVVNPARDYGDMPLVVLTATKQDDVPEHLMAELPAQVAAWRLGHDQVAALSSRGVARLVPEAGHYVQIDRPDVVIATVLEVVEAARARRP